MSMDAINQVAEAEEKARAMRQQAQSEAQALLDRAQQEGQAKVEAARRDALAQVKQQLAQAEDQGQETTRAALTEYQKHCEELKAKAAQRLDQAARLIVGKVVRD